MPETNNEQPNVNAASEETPTQNQEQAKETAKPKEYAIGIIAVPRQTGLSFHPPAHKSLFGQPVKGEGTMFYERGLYQAVGHTSVITFEGEKVKEVAGLFPAGFFNTIKAVTMGSTVPGMWHDDRSMLNDPTAMMTKIPVDEATFKLFQEFFEKTKKEITEYTLMPFKASETNCVHSAILVYVNFFYKYQDRFPKEEWEKVIEPKLREIIEDTAEKKNTMQGNMMANITKWNKDVDCHKLQLDLIDLVSDALHKMKDSTDTERQEVGKFILLELKKLDPGKLSQDDFSASIAKLVAHTEVFVRNQKDPEQNQRPLSEQDQRLRDSWDRLINKYSLDVKVAETNISNLSRIVDVKHRVDAQLATEAVKKVEEKPNR